MSNDHYVVWGQDQIDPNAISQMDAAMSIAPAVAGALMPDAHLGYGLPIGGVLALDNAVCPYAVGVDIACRMKLSIFNIEPEYLDSEKQHFIDVLRRNTMFGVGVENRRDYDHPVLDLLPWSVSPSIIENRDRAIKQLGTSGSGNQT